MTKAVKEKRDILKKLSHTSIIMADYDDLDTENMTVNELLMMYIYNIDQEFNFKTFKGWKDDGYTIKKGSKAFIVWGQPIKNKNKEEQGENPRTKQEEEEREDKFFPMAYLFRNDQVLKPIRKKRTPTTQAAPEPEPEFIEDLPF